MDEGANLRVTTADAAHYAFSVEQLASFLTNLNPRDADEHVHRRPLVLRAAKDRTRIILLRKIPVENFAQQVIFPNETPAT